METETLYNADAEQRFAFDAYDGSEKYDTAHRFKSLTDERYLEYLRAIKLSDNGDDLESSDIEATNALWDDLIIEVENIEFDEGADWKSLIDFKEKKKALEDLLAVVIYQPETTANGKRKISADKNIEIYTEAFFSGEPLRQKHVLRQKTLDRERQFDKLESKRFKQDTVKGLSKTKPKTRYIPQDDKIAELYDEMIVSVEGFQTETNPMRFKASVLNYLFAPKIDEKK